MPRRRIPMVSDPYFDEFIYDIIYSLTPTQRRQLDGKYAQACSTPKRAQSFARTAPLEQKYFLLALLGIKRATVLFDEKTTWANFKAILQNYRERNPGAGLKELAAQRVYISTDREFMFSLISMAQSIHHPQYTMSMEMNKLGYRLSQWGAWKKSIANAEFIKANENIETVNRFSLLLEQQSKTMETLEPVFRITYPDFRILNMLFRNRHRYVSRHEMITYFKGCINKPVVSASLFSLKKEVLIQGSALTKNEVTITATGINLMDKIFQRILSSNNF